MARLALEGIRVIDMGVAWAGPHCTGLLADMGAEVIKVEATNRPDLRGGARVRPAPAPTPAPGAGAAPAPAPAAGMGMYPNNDPGQRPWNRSGMFNQQQRNRLGITLDLTNDKAKEVYKKLVKISDILVENFSARVMINFGLGYSVLSQINPGLIMISMSGFGMTGPESGYRSYGSTLEQLTGIASTMGYPDGPPMPTGIFYPDPTAGTLGAGTVIAALHQRRKTGKGVFIEMSQREATLRVLGDGLLGYQMNKRTPPRIGNRDLAMAPHGCYRCQEEDSWIAIAVRNDEEWWALCQAMDKPELADDERFADILSRHQNHDELDAIIEEWTKKHDHIAAMHLLQDAGVPAGALLNAREAFYDPDLNDRGVFEKITHPEAGDLTLVGMAWKLSKSPGSIRKPAPCLGEHNHYVLGELLGLSDAEIEELEKEHVIGYEPVAPPLP